VVTIIAYRNGMKPHQEGEDTAAGPRNLRSTCSLTCCPAERHRWTSFAVSSVAPIVLVAHDEPPVSCGWSSIFLRRLPRRELHLRFLTQVFTLGELQGFTPYLFRLFWPLLAGEFSSEKWNVARRRVGDSLWATAGKSRQSDHCSDHESSSASGALRSSHDLHFDRPGPAGWRDRPSLFGDHASSAADPPQSTQWD